MKYLLHRLTALLLAVLLLCSAGSALVLAAPERFDPACVLGTEPSDMLAAGGRRVQAGDRQLYIDDADGAVYALGSPRELILEGPVAKLNYADGVLYYAREREESCFDLCAFAFETQEEKVLLSGFSGKIGQLYLVNGAVLDFSCGNAVWELELETGGYRLMLYADQLRSFVPTGCGLIYATGSLFDYSLYADGKLLAEHVTDYTLRFDLGRGLLVYIDSGKELQADLAAAFAGTAVPTAFTGTGDRSYTYSSLSADLPMTPEQEAQAAEAEAQRLEAELAEAMAQPENRITVTGGGAPAASAEGSDSDPQQPADPEPTEPADPEPTEPADPEPTEPADPEPTEPADPEPTEPADPEPTEPADPEPTEPEPSEPAEPDPIDPEPTEPTDPEPTEPDPTEPEEPGEDADPDDPAPAEPGVDPNPPVEVEDPPVVPTAVFPGSVLRAPMSEGQQNIIKRARQMLNIKWTPRRNVGGWGYTDSSYSLRILYTAGTTYTGLPYGQCVKGSYVPWSTSLSGFAAAVQDPNSKMYTTRNSYSRGSQYYGTDCSGFASWAWQTDNRKDCGRIVAWEHTYTVGRSYTLLQAGDILIKSGHARMITDVTYNADGSIYSVEISEANPTAAYTGCCYSTRYTGQAALESMNKSLFTNGPYTIYRSDARDTVTYTHDCAVPLEGDVCPICGAGMDVEPDTPVQNGVDLSVWNGDVDWMVLSTQIDFAILRLGYTGNGSDFAMAKDARFDANAAGCEAYGVPYGVYWYAGAKTEAEAIQEAEAVIEYLGLMTGSGYLPSLPIFYDVEEARNILQLTDTELLTVISAFCGTLENFGLRAGIYANTYVWNNRLTSSAYSQWARWAAQWESSELTASGGANVWQYSSTGALPGVEGNVDLNYWLGEPGSTEHPATAVVTPPSCLEYGTVTCTCVSHGEVTELGIPALGHDYVDGVCSRCGLHEVFERFTDVDPNRWYADALVWAVENGITAGTSSTTFSPNQTCTREQVMTFLWKAKGSPQPADEDNPFLDVRDEKYYCPAVLWAYYHEPQITSGVDANNFGVGQGCTRGQVVTFLWNAAGQPEPETAENPFEDVQEPDYYYNAVLWAYQNGITSGVTASAFCPKQTCTRAQIVTFLYAAWKNR